MTEIKRKPVIHDNDGSMDDAIALLYLLIDDNIHVKAITMPGTGEAGPKGAENIAALAAYVNKPNIPVAYGNDSPLGPVQPVEKAFPSYIRAAVDNLLDNTGIQPSLEPILDDPVELMRKTLAESSEPVTILATGPLTNVALLIEKYPLLANDKIEKIVIMGGAYKVPGNIQGLDPKSQNKVAEWNIIADPEAADVVFSSGIPIQSIALDATNQVKITESFMASLKSNPHPIIQVVYTFYVNLKNAVGDKVFDNDVYLWDALAAMLLKNEDLSTYEQASVTVDMQNAKTIESQTPPLNVSIARKLREPSAILEMLVQGLTKQSALKTPEPVAAITHQFNHLRLDLKKPGEVKLPDMQHLVVRLKNH